MNILCLSNDDEVDFLAPDPVEELTGHKVECVSTYRGAQDLLRESDLGFDIILADVQVPLSAQDEQSMPSALLMSYLRDAGVRGFGMFVPAHFQIYGTAPQGDDFALVASKECVTPADQRDWKKLLSLVQEQMH